MKKAWMALVFCGWVMPVAASAQTEGGYAGLIAAPESGRNNSRQQQQQPAQNMYPSFKNADGNDANMPQKRLDQLKAAVQKNGGFRQAASPSEKADEAAKNKAIAAKAGAAKLAKYQKALAGLQLRQQQLEEEARLELEQANSGGARQK